MKIIFCLHHFLPGYIAGTEMYTLRLAQHLKQADCDIVILIPNFGFDQTEAYEYEGIRVIKYAENSIEDREMIMGKTKPMGLSVFSDILLLEKPDIIHFHELAPGRGISIFHVENARKLGIPVVLTFHLSYYTCFKGSLIYKNNIKCDGIIRVNRCTECVYHSKEIAGIKGKLFSMLANTLYITGVNSSAVNNSVGTALSFPFIIKKIKTDLLKLSDASERIIVLTGWYREMLMKNGIPANKLVLIKQGLTHEPGQAKQQTMASLPLKVVFLGRISALKGVDILIDAFAKLDDDKISLDIYGQESEPGFMASCKRKTVAKKNIKWMGPISPAQVLSTLANYHLLCLPSVFSEMSPLVIQEAFAAGIPVIASDVYGNAEQISDGVNGWLFRFRDSNDLAEKLKALLENVGIIERARQNLPVPGSFEGVANKHLAIYSEILGNKKSTRPENSFSHLP